MPFCQGGARNVKINCAKCSNDITEIQNYLLCDGCGMNFHTKCANIIGNHINRAAAEGEWYCKACNDSNVTTNNQGSRESAKRKASDSDVIETENFSKKINLSISTDEKLDKILDSISQLNSLYFNIKTDIDEVKNNQEFISNRFDEFNQKIEVMSKDNKQMRKDIDSDKIVQDYHTLQIAELQSELDNLKQKEINNNIIISNLPNGIDPKDTVSKILNILEASADINDIISIKLLPSKQNNEQDNTSNAQQNNNRNNNCLLVAFKNYQHKNDFMNKKKIKKSLLTKEIGLNTSSDQIVYIRDHVTQFKMKLFQECKKLKRKYLLKHLWMSGSNILIRQFDGSKVYQIKTFTDIINLEKILSGKEVIQNKNNNKKQYTQNSNT